MKRCALLAVFALLFGMSCPKPKPMPKKKKTTAEKVAYQMGRLSHKDKKARDKAVAALVKIGEPAVLPLIGLLKGDTAVRTTVGLGLIGTTGGGSAVVLKGDDSAKAHAANALGRIGDERAMDPLIEALGDEDAGKAASEALKAITKQDFGMDAEKWKEWKEGAKEE